MTDTRDVVVGYDGSDFSMQALEWAMDEAELEAAADRGPRVAVAVRRGR